MHVHAAVTAHKMTARYALDLKPGDIYWCTADPGLGNGHLLWHCRATCRGSNR